MGIGQWEVKGKERGPWRKMCGHLVPVSFSWHSGWAEDGRGGQRGAAAGAMMGRASPLACEVLDGGGGGRRVLAEALTRVLRPAVQLRAGTLMSFCAAGKDNWYNPSGGNLAMFIEITAAVP